MGLIAWLIFGLIAGMAASFLRFATTIALGVVGALLGGLVGRVFGWYQEGDPIRFAVALVGAIALLILFRFIVRRPSHAA